MLLKSFSVNLVLLAAFQAGPAIAAICNLTPDYAPPVVADGWTATLLTKDLKEPRSLLFDTSGNLLVIQQGSGVIHLTLNDGGGSCFEVASTKELIDNSDLNHGLALSEDGRTLYASSPASVYAYEYDPSGPSVGQSREVINNMANGGHSTRTLLLSRKQANTLVVSRGSDGNIDNRALDLSSGHSTIKAFDISNTTVHNHDDGMLLGWGLRNSVGVAEHPVTGGIYSVENSADQLQRNGVDIHQNNPGEELNYHGFLNGSAENQGGNYGYPTCFAVWNTSIPEIGDMQVGSQFVLDTTSTTQNDAFCAEEMVPPALTFHDHTAPLDIKFLPDGTEAFVTFHGSWNREVPAGYRLSRIAFSPSTGAPVAPSNSTTATTDILSNPSLEACPDDCFRPVGLALDGQNRLFMTSDSTGEIWVVSRSNNETGTPTGSASTPSPTPGSAKRLGVGWIWTGVLSLGVAFSWLL